jgi:putative ABC transport system ATP-binding protein
MVTKASLAFYDRKLLACVDCPLGERVAVARALINNPAVVIADEPTAHLDTTLSLELVNILGRLKEDGKTVLIASHDPLVCGSKIVDHLIQCRDGKIDGQDP